MPGDSAGARHRLEPSNASSHQRVFPAVQAQLLAVGLFHEVDARTSTRSKIAYEYSGTFVRSEPMMAARFAAMGFAKEQIDGLFAAASKL